MAVGLGLAGPVAGSGSGSGVNCLASEIVHDEEQG